MINYELERIFKYLESEVESSKGVIPLNDRLAIAEFGLLESQMSSINTLEVNALDEDVLKVLVDQVIDFKRRLGIDYYVQGVNLDVDSIRVYFSEVRQSEERRTAGAKRQQKHHTMYLHNFLLSTHRFAPRLIPYHNPFCDSLHSSQLGETIRDGTAFYVKGVRLLANDLKYSFALFSKALTGYTLKPREVRTLRRTFKDLFTFIPFIIILIIPLTPIGHVFVFGAIQRFFPDFFPSCFTERRQNLLQLFEQSEFQKIEIDENLLQQVNRAIVGFFTLIAVSAKDAIVGVVGGGKGGGEGGDGGADGEGSAER